MKAVTQAVIVVALQVEAIAQVEVATQAEAAQVEVVPALVAAATQEVLAVAVPAAAMFPAVKQKNVPLLKVREAIAAAEALPVHPKEVTIREDNLFLYYIYHYHCSTAVGELDSGISPTRLFRALPVTWISGRIYIRLVFVYHQFCSLKVVVFFACNVKIVY